MSNTNRKKLVLQMTSVHIWNDTRIYRKICRSLKAEGVEVALAACEPANADATETEDVKVHWMRRPSGRLSRMLITPFRLLRIVLRLRPHICHYHDPELIPLAVFLRLLGFRVIYDIHESLAEQVLSKAYLPRWSRLPISWFSRIIQWVGVATSTRSIAATDKIARDFGKKCTPLRNYPLLNELCRPDGDGDVAREPLVYYVGAISRIRAACEMVEAIRLLPDSICEEFIMAGPTNEKGLDEELRRRAEGLPVTFPGSQAREVVATTLQRASVGLVLYLPAPNHTEAQPNKLFEYMSAGVPVVASHFPLWRKVVEGEKCGLVVNPAEPKEIAKAIGRILEDLKSGREMGQNGRKAVIEKFNWEAEFRNLLNVYAQLGLSSE